MIDLQRILRVEAFGGGEISQIPDLTTRATAVTPWPSEVEEVDRIVRERFETGGGFYGTACIAGRFKLGKSMLALRSAVAAALKGWTVIDHDLESDDTELAIRLLNILGVGAPHWPAEMDLFNIRTWGQGADLHKIADVTAQLIQPGDTKVLVMIDSANRLAKRMVRNDTKYRGGHGYFRALEDVFEWASSATRFSEGRMGMLLTAEQNRAGSVVGMDPEYSSDCILYIRGGDVPGEVELEFVSRRTRSESLGIYERRFGECRFAKPGSPTSRLLTNLPRGGLDRRIPEPDDQEDIRSLFDD
jgi:hypothetical protein